MLKAVDAESGIVDHMAGDGVMAMWIPAFVGEDHSRQAIAASWRIAAEIDETLPIAIGVHTGIAYVGVVGQDGAKDFTALGDIPNTASRLSSGAQAGEVIFSAESASAASDGSVLGETEMVLESHTSDEDGSGTGVNTITTEAAPAGITTCELPIRSGTFLRFLRGP